MIRLFLVGYMAAPARCSPHHRPMHGDFFYFSSSLRLPQSFHFDGSLFS